MRPSTVLAVVLVALLVVAGVTWVGGDSGGGACRVTAETPDGPIALEMAVADTARERSEGLSGTTEIPADGMVFVYDAVGTRTFVMREMNYPLDIVFVADGEVTAIHHAPVEDPPLTRYSGRARYVLELPYDWTTRHDVTVGSDVSVCFGS